MQKGLTVAESLLVLGVAMTYTLVLFGEIKLSCHLFLHVPLFSSVHILSKQNDLLAHVAFLAAVPTLEAPAAAFGSVHRVASLERHFFCVSIVLSLNSSLVLSRGVCREAPEELLKGYFTPLLVVEMSKLPLRKENVR